MARLFIKGHLKDFDIWKPIFDELEPTRKAYGISGHRLYRGTDDPNDITITFEAGDLERAKAFAASEDLRSAMARAGVERPPEFWYAEDIEQKRYSKSTAEAEERVTAAT